MKTKTATTIAAIAMALFILTSCGIMKKDDFTSRKYTHFKKGETAINIKTTKTDKNELQNVSDESKVAKTADVAPVATKVAEPQSNNNNIAKNNTDNSKSVANNEQTSTPSDKVKTVKRSVPLFLERQLQKAKKTSVSNGDVDDLVLLILAIIVPPVAVYLAKGICQDFWIDLILALLIILYPIAIIYALIVIFVRR